MGTKDGRFHMATTPPLWEIHILRTMDRTGQGVPPAATTAAREISLVRVRARTADTNSWTKLQRLRRVHHYRPILVNAARNAGTRKTHRFDIKNGAYKKRCVQKTKRCVQKTVRTKKGAYKKQNGAYKKRNGAFKKQNGAYKIRTYSSTPWYPLVRIFKT